MKVKGRLSIVFSGILLVVCLFSCTSEAGKKKGNISPETAKAEEAFLRNGIIPGKDEFKITYHFDSIADANEMDSLFLINSASQLHTLFAINRIDKHRVVPGLKLVVPDTLSETLMLYSPFPESLDLLDSIPKVLLISQRIQAFAVYDNGILCRWGPVSSGKQSTPTPNGLHYANYKAKRKISTVNGSWVMPYYVNYMNFAGIGTHQYTLPGFPASHSCVRLFLEDAMYIYYWIEMWKLQNNEIIQNGTPFMVFGEYDFEADPPWYSLVENPGANEILPEELDTIKEFIKKYELDPLNSKVDSLREVKVLF